GKMTECADQTNPLWEMRWWTNLMAFRSDNNIAAQYLNQSRYEYFNDMFNVLKKNRKKPEKVLQEWLSKISEHSNLSSYKLHPSEAKLVSHLQSFYGEYLPEEKVNAIVKTFRSYKAKYP